MLLPNCGSFLTQKEKSESAFIYNKPLIRLCCVGFLIFSFASFATMGGAVFYATYSAPHQTVSATAYSKAHAASSRVTKSLALLKESRPSGIDVCKVMDTVSAAVSGANGDISLKDVTVRPQNYTIKGYGKDINTVNDYMRNLDFPSTKFQKQLSDVKSNTKVTARPPMPGAKIPADSLASKSAPVEFTIVVTPKVAQKKAPAPKAASNNAAKGGKH